jgi:hypothetical protein
MVYLPDMDSFLCCVFSVLYCSVTSYCSLLLFFFCVCYRSLFLYCAVSACGVRAATLTEVFQCFPSVVKQMSEYKSQRRGTACTSQISFNFFYCYVISQFFVVKYVLFSVFCVLFVCKCSLYYCTMGTGSFPGVKRPGLGADHPSSSSAEVTKEWSYTSIHPIGQFRPVMGQLYLLLLPAGVNTIAVKYEYISYHISHCLR